MKEQSEFFAKNPNFVYKIYKLFKERKIFK